LRNITYNLQRMSMKKNEDYRMHSQLLKSISDSAKYFAFWNHFK